MQEVLSSAILSNTFSMTDLYRRADLLQRFLENAFFEVKALGAKRVPELRAYYRDSDPETAAHAAAIATWGEEKLAEYSAENLYDRIRALKQAVRTLPKLTLYVPVHFAPAQTERIGAWCRSTIAPDIILDLRIDPAAVGGCAFVYNSSFHDVSFTYFSRKSRAALVDMIRRHD